ncbi:MAG TPA: sialate O-acetylesterase [Phycisphaerales bacterium]|nr:sialate O-acetylesterase [Phycisphaerales bacterium]
MRITAPLFIAALTATSGLAEVKTAAIFGSGMVLQQKSQTPVWGWASPGEEIQVVASWLPAPLSTTADPNGRWMVKLKTPAAVELKSPGTLEVRGANTLRFDNIAIGEVWLCSGQSNMEWTVGISMNAKEEVAAANHPSIRYFTVANEVAIAPREDCRGEFGGWRVMSPATAADCTAVGYYFARELQKQMGVPVGIIASDWGGTPVESWASNEVLARTGEYKEYRDLLASLDPDPAKRQAALDGLGEKWWKSVDENPKSPGKDWTSGSFDDSAWQTMNMPGAWQGDLAQFDGFVYFRTVIDVPADAASGAAVLELPPIDDRDDAWINGVHVGSLHAPNAWNNPRKYQVPAGTLKPGKNVISLRIRDDRGNGGAVGDASAMNLRIGGKAIPLAGQWKYKVGPSVAESPYPPLADGINAWTPSSLYNAMIHPLRNYTIAGALWYQGESNRGRGAQYLKVFPAMIEGWRSDWKLGEFPFYLVQLAPFNYGNDPGLTSEIREVQHLTTTMVPHTAMVCTMDIGNPADIHPLNKQEVGRRLALNALNKHYGKDGIICSGPTYKSMKVDGDAIVVEFDLHGGKEITVKGDALLHFQIAGADKVFHRATATIQGNTVRVSRDGLKAPVAVRYGWEGACETNVFGADNLPMEPFRTDDWAMPVNGWPAPKE